MHVCLRGCIIGSARLSVTLVASNNRICCHFEPNESYQRDNPSRKFNTVARRFAWFGTNMEPGVLFEFFYNTPPQITRTAVLRVPDYHNNTWKRPNG